MKKLACVGVFAFILVAVVSVAGQDKKDDPAKKDDITKARNAIPTGWKDLKLSTEQKDKVYKIHAEYKAKEDELLAKVKKLKEEELAEKVKVLTEEQKKKLTAALVPESAKDKDKDKKDK